MDLSKIKSPEFVKNLTYPELDELASDIRNCIIDTVSKHGGHLSSNLGCVELTIALHKCFNSPVDKLLFDVGHQTYTHKILTGRYNQFVESLRCFDGLSGYQKRHESEHDIMEAGHSSTSISIAEGLAIARDLNKEDYHVVAVIGDASISSGVALEAINHLAEVNNKVIIVLNDNEMSISKPVGGISKFLTGIRGSSKYQKSKEYFIGWSKHKITRPLYKLLKKAKNGIKYMTLGKDNVFESMGLEYLGPFDGHNIKDIVKGLENAKKMNSSTIIHVLTKKGKGYEKAEQDLDGSWHGVGSFYKETGERKSNDENSLSWSSAISSLIDEFNFKNENTVLLTPAMISGSKLKKLFFKYPDRTIDVGISEEHAVTMAAGLALGGKKPIISIYSTFMQRAYDNLNHDLARMNLGAIISVDRAGLVGQDGETHHGIFDVAICKSLPNSCISMPLDYNDAANLFNLSLNTNILSFIRYPRENLPLDTLNYQINDMKIGQWDYLINNSNENLIISTGPVTNKVKELILNENLNCDLLFARFYNPIDIEKLKEGFSKYKNIIVYDIYSIKEGLFDTITSCAVECHYNGNLINMSLPTKFIQHGTIEELLEYLKLDINSLKYTIKLLK